MNKVFIIFIAFLFLFTLAASTTTQDPAECGSWSEWDCNCCGGCSTQRCTRTCQTTADCTSCSGEAEKEDPTPCSSPSETCKFPLPVCCDGQEAYVNHDAQPVARYCRATSS